MLQQLHGEGGQADYSVWSCRPRQQQYTVALEVRHQKPALVERSEKPAPLLELELVQKFRMGPLRAFGGLAEEPVSLIRNGTERPHSRFYCKAKRHAVLACGYNIKNL